MKVTVDARILRGGGIGRFIREVTGPWLDRQEIDELTFLGDPEELEPWLHGRGAEARARIVRWTDATYSPRVQLRIAGSVAKALRSADVRFFPHYDAPVVGLHSPSVVVVHDLTQFQPGAPFPLHKRVLGHHLLKSVVRRATRVVTVSQNSGRDLVARVPSAERVTRVVRPGVSEIFLNPREKDSEDAYLWESFRPYLLTVGAPRPHKRIDFAVDLLAELRREGRKDLTLISVGAPGGPGCPVRRRAVQRGVSDSVLSLGRVDDRTLRELYRGAEALLFPSLYEGFGLPVAEAGALGCPVIASNRASIPEAADERAVLLDPFDLQAWKRAFLELNGTSRNGNGHAHPNGNGNGMTNGGGLGNGHGNGMVNGSGQGNGHGIGMVNGSGNGHAHRNVPAAAATSWTETSAAVFSVLEEALAEGRGITRDLTPAAPAVDQVEPSARPRGSSRSIKRGVDTLVAAIGLVLASPVLLACAAAVYLTSGRPIFFGHARCGLHGRSFRCLKFRTMVHDAEDILHRREDLREHYLGNGYKLPRCGDPRITRVGHFLRYTHLDELPQLLNVLRGDMAIVGPRPVIEAELEEYGVGRATLLSVRPGIFGAWTAMGKERPPYPERVEVELSYARDPGLRRDLSILLRNIPVLIWGQTDE